AVVVPVNLYGPGDNFDPRSSHVVPALIRKCVEARARGAAEVVCWGTGTATREFLYVDDAAEGVVRAAEVLEEPVPVNLGGGAEISIRELAQKIAKACDFCGRIVWDTSRPDGQPRRALDITQARRRLAWEPKQNFDVGLAATVRWWREQGTSAPDPGSP
ncbi:MAG: NAD-dependent epimerase/dehydratase family protein, partial [Planctomycetota bacterium]